MPFGIGMNQDLDIGKFRQQFGLDLIHHLMRMGDGHVPVHPHMELHEIPVAAGPRAQIVDAAQFGMARQHLDKAGLFVLGPFVVHQLLDGLLAGLPCAPAQPQRDAQAEQRIGPVKPA
jgi:hypothetical protein